MCTQEWSAPVARRLGMPSSLLAAPLWPFRDLWGPGAPCPGAQPCYLGTSHPLEPAWRSEGSSPLGSWSARLGHRRLSAGLSPPPVPASGGRLERGGGDPVVVVPVRTRAGHRGGKPAPCWTYQTHWERRALPRGIWGSPRGLHSKAPPTFILSNRPRKGGGGLRQGAVREQAHWLGSREAPKVHLDSSCPLAWKGP